VEPECRGAPVGGLRGRAQSGGSKNPKLLREFNLFAR